MIRQALRFGLIGLINTLVGYAVIIAALTVGFGDYTSNALGYATGLLLGFILNRNWAFADVGDRMGRSKSQFIHYVIAFAFAYGVNLAVLTLLRSDGALPSYLAQLAAMISYSATFFFLCRWLVFPASRAHPTKEPAGPAV